MLETHNWGDGERYTAKGSAEMAQRLSSQGPKGIPKICQECGKRYICDKVIRQCPECGGALKVEVKK